MVIGIAPRLGEFGYEKQDDAVEGVILLRTGEKTQDVLTRVEAKTKELNEVILPKDVKVVPFYDRSDLVALTTQVVERNLLRGMLLVVVILIFFLYDFRAGLIVATTIPLGACCLRSSAWICRTPRPTCSPSAQWTSESWSTARSSWWKTSFASSPRAAERP